MAKRFLVATRKGLFEIQKQALGKWEISNRYFLGVPVTMMLRDPYNRYIYAALLHGHFGAKLHRSDDDGKTWREIASPKYDCISGRGTTSLQMIWSLESGKDTLWAGTIPGGLFKSTDGGETWSLIRSLWDQPLREEWLGGGYDDPGIHSICLDSRNSSRLSVAISCGGVWLSEDGGETWKQSCPGLSAEFITIEFKESPATQDPHRLVQCKNQPGNFWIQHHNGIARSTNYCKNWKKIKANPSSFGFTVVVHPNDPDTAWFVPAIKDEKRYPVDGKFIVTRTTDGGETFSTLSAGLPQDENYEIVYRHGMDIDNSGECLVMGTTTGSLWVSENGGDYWIEVTRSLPPISAVRFI